jgi:outer membrane biosynthesis protein TonB
MNRFARVTLVASALSLTLALAGCESFDPTEIFSSDMFSTKKKLQGDRRAVFPEGTPGVSQGVPQELVKGYQAPTEPEPVAAQPEEPKPKPKPKPKTVAKPAPPPPEQRAPTATAARPDPPQQPRQQPAAGGWPGSPQPQGGVAWPDPPSTTR